MSPDDPRHGQYRGYRAHRVDGEEACDPCKRAAAAAEARRHLPGASRRTDPAGCARRVQALVALGWTYLDMQRISGIEDAELRRFALGERSYVFTTTVAKVDAAYRQLCMVLPPENTPAERQARTKARRMAARNGWVPPLAWDDIDDPDESPSGATSHRLHVARERTFATADHRACPRCGVIRQTHVDHTRGDLCRDCHEALPTEAVSA